MERLLVKDQFENQFSIFEELILTSKRMLIGAVTIVVLLLGYNLSNTDSLSINSILGVQEITLDDSYNSAVYSYYGESYE